jgi:hypothetical protein
MPVSATLRRGIGKYLTKVHMYVLFALLEIYPGVCSQQYGNTYAWVIHCGFVCNCENLEMTEY